MRAMECDLAVIGHVVCRAGRFPRGEVRIREGRVVAVSPTPGEARRREQIDVGDAYVLPGVIDPHVHSLSHPGEGVSAATRSAAAGGVTTVMEMPFDSTGPIWTAGRLTAKRQMVANEAHVDVALYATVRPGGGAGEIPGLAGAGAACFKVSTYHTDPERFPRTPDNEMLEVFRAIAATGRRVCLHAENDEIVKALVAALRADGERDPRLHCASRPPVTETAAVANALELSRGTGVKLHFCHLSLPRSVELVRSYARQGVPATGEVCPHYLTFAEDDMLVHGARLKINPPVRADADVDGLWELLRADAIDALASDHAPWPLSEKDRPNIFDNSSGAPGVETLLPVVASEGLHRRGVSIESLVRATSWRPAAIFGLGHRKGDLRPGLDADIAVFDPSAEWTLDEANQHSNAGWSPYHGRALRGRVTMTISRGEVVYDGKQVTSVPGRGRIVESGTEPRGQDGR